MTTFRTIQLSIALLLGASPLLAQSGTTFREQYQSGLAALQAGDTVRYLHQLEGAHALLEPGSLNRPFIQYHVARGYAMMGDQAQSLYWLSRMLDEKIEGLMIYYAAFDPAFDQLRSSAGYQALIERARDTEISVTKLGGNVWLVEGGGCMVLASIGPDGVLLVDTGYALAATAVRRALRSHGGRDIRYIVNTHFHEDHVGGNANLGSQGAIIAHPETRAALSESQTFIDGVDVPARAGPALPNILTGERMEIHFNGERIVLVPLPGHTEGDLIVYFTESKVLDVGDRFFPDDSRFIWPGQQPSRHIATLDDLLAEVSPEAVVVSGHAQPRPLADFMEAHQRTAEMIEFIRTGRAAKKPLGQLEMEGEERGYPKRWIQGLYQAVGAEGEGE